MEMKWDRKPSGPEKGWFIWFAWYPVLTHDYYVVKGEYPSGTGDKWVWLERVWKRVRPPATWISDSTTYYMRMN
jgi:hypothetical protein